MKKKNETIKISFLAILTFCLLSTSLPAFPKASSDDSIEVAYTYTFTTPAIEKVRSGDKIFDTVSLDDLPEAGEYGKPILPVKELRLLIPYGYEVSSIDVNPSEPISLGSGYTLQLGSKDVPLSLLETSPLPVREDEQYPSAGVFPGSLFNLIGTYGFRGYQILYVNLNPVHYQASTGELSYYAEMNLNLKMDKTSTVAINELYRGSDSDKTQLKDKVDNLEVSETYPSIQRQTRDDYDLLIITTDALKTCFEPLAEYHTSQGLSTYIATLSDIGSTDPEAIRSYIRTAYLNQHIEYVLLGGDADVVPARMLWATSGYGDTDVMPADVYYACLDGPYNSDGDERWGEPNDGENGKDVDLVAEVYVGRACVGDSFEVDNFIQKTVSYVYTVDAYLGKVLMVGEFLWPDPDTYGCDYMDELINGSDANGYSTVGIPWDRYFIDKLYDRDWPTHNWPKEELINRINDNVHLINHLGHSSYDYNMKMYSSDVDGLTNTRYFFAYSQGCDNGGFDNPLGFDCIAEHFTVKTAHGAFAVVANARYGYGQSGGTDGANQRFHRQFIDAIFGEDIIQLGRANQDSKEENLPRINQRVMRWCYYEINLLGDPTIDFFTHYSNSPPGTPGVPVGPTSGEVGVNYTYTIYANADPEGDMTYYKFYWDDGTASQWFGPCLPSDTVSATHAWRTAGNYHVVVKCRDSYWGMSNLSEPLSVEITGPFFEIGTISGGLFTASAEIKNVGAGAATQVKRSITVEGVRNKRIFYVTNSTIDLLGPGDTTLAQTDKPILGFGKVKITAAAMSPGGETYAKTVDGFVLLCVVFVFQ
jgi:hypothetical protein